MSTPQRIYLVSDGSQTILVQAANQAQALRHVAGTRYAITAAKPIDVAQAMSKGISLEVAGEDQHTAELFGEEQGA